jgi:hypothetical protein
MLGWCGHRGHLFNPNVAVDRKARKENPVDLRTFPDYLPQADQIFPAFRPRLDLGDLALFAVFAISAVKNSGSIIEKFGRPVNVFLSCVARTPVPGPIITASTRATSREMPKGTQRD